MSSSIKTVASVIALLAISACSQTGGPSNQVTSSIFANPAHYDGYIDAQPLQTSEAYVTLPADYGKTLSVNERLYSNGIQQRAVYPASLGVKGENYIEVNLVQGHQLYGLEKKLDVHDKSARALTRKFRTEFPGHQLAVSNAPSSNRFGAYGISHVKLDGNITCIFAWQNMEAKDVGYRGDFILNRLRRPGKIELSYRIRYCKPGMTMTDGHHMMRNISISATPESLRKRALQLWQAGTAHVPSGTQYAPPSVIPQPIVQPVVAPEPVASAPPQAVVDKVIQRKKTLPKAKPVTSTASYEEVPLP